MNNNALVPIMMSLPAPLPIRRLVWIAFWSLGLLAALFEGEIFMALVCLVLLVHPVRTRIWESFSGEEKVSNVEEIKCTNCQQRLNIPRNHTGLAGCPACMMKILLKDGEISD